MDSPGNDDGCCAVNSAVVVPGGRDPVEIVNIAHRVGSQVIGKFRHVSVPALRLAEDPPVDAGTSDVNRPPPRANWPHCVWLS